MKTIKNWIPGLVVCALLGCADDPDTLDYQGFTEPTGATIKHNREFASRLPVADQEDFEFARRGLIAADNESQTETADGRVIWDIPSYQFLGGEAPDSVNPTGTPPRAMAA